MAVQNLRYLQRYRSKSEQKLVKGYLREIIRSYGIDVVYFRKDLDFYQTPSGSMANYTYGESTTSTYFISGDMVVYMDMENDSFLLNKFGIETDGDSSIYFTIDDFYEQYRDKVAIITSSLFDTDIQGIISGYNGIILGYIENDLLSGITSAAFSDISGGYQPSGSWVSGSFFEPVNNIYKYVHEKIYNPREIKYDDRFISGQLSGFYSGFIDSTGYGVLTGNVSGELLYFSDIAENTPTPWKIAPQVGDFFRISFENDNNEEYEITRVYDRNLQTDGVNPLLGKYIWRCQCTRRDPSYEEVMGDAQEEPWTTDKSEQNIWHEQISNDIFNYEKQDIDCYDPKDSDDVYGGYGNDEKAIGIDNDI